VTRTRASALRQTAIHSPLSRSFFADREDAPPGQVSGRIDGPAARLALSFTRTNREAPGKLLNRTLQFRPGEDRNGSKLGLIDAAGSAQTFSESL
jgi:hypothetical protein